VLSTFCRRLVASFEFPVEFRESPAVEGAAGDGEDEGCDTNRVGFGVGRGPIARETVSSSDVTELREGVDEGDRDGTLHGRSSEAISQGSGTKGAYQSLAQTRSDKKGDKLTFPKPRRGSRRSRSMIELGGRGQSIELRLR